MERGRSEFFRGAGIARLAMLGDAEQSAWTLRRISVEFSRPARLDDLVEVHTLATALTGARMSADQRIFRGGEILVRGAVEACIMTLAGRPRRIPQDVRERLLPLIDAAGIARPASKFGHVRKAG
ncbi:MAG: acyl-CoA thioesterase [Rhizomicrobium sp.]